MGVPTIPAQPNRPTLEETMVDLLEAIALEKMALANLIDAEAGKIQAYIGPERNFPTAPSNRDLADFHQSSLRLLESVIFQQRMIVQKLYLLKDFSSSGKTEVVVEKAADDIVPEQPRLPATVHANEQHSFELEEEEDWEDDDRLGIHTYDEY